MLIKNVNQTIDDLKDDVKRAVVAIADTAGQANELIASVSSPSRHRAGSAL